MMQICKSQTIKLLKSCFHILQNLSNYEKIEVVFLHECICFDLKARGKYADFYPFIDSLESR